MSKPIVLVTGGRNYADESGVAAVLSSADPGLVIEGGARGADELARRWAMAHGVHVVEVEALWNAFGKRAGGRRNAVMVELCKRLGGTVVAFPGGTGTADCVRRARAAGLVVVEVDGGEG